MNILFFCASCGMEKPASRRSAGRQLYCGEADCQRVRKSSWQRRRMAVDLDHRGNQRRCSQAWRKRHPGYWSDYRQRNPGQAERNRELQRERNRQKRGGPPPRADPIDPLIANIDASTSKSLKSLGDGEYWLKPVIANIDALKVIITVIPRDYE